ncbi:unnamed protein product [Phytophthora fragariaefolia]|uniref:Unnamed protein product n=1 Tax=Phytophthora fragariaefolia TaxID=1490495 RepID=A0A9W6XNR9_9STRA|nr:unnamed protein product [Phytophthora fragariaefolia]
MQQQVDRLSGLAQRFCSMSGMIGPLTQEQLAALESTTHHSIGNFAISHTATLHTFSSSTCGLTTISRIWMLVRWTLCGDGKLGYIAVSNCNPIKPFTFKGREYPPAVDLEGKGSGPDSATPRTSITPRPSDAGEEDENDGDGGDGNNSGSDINKKKKGKEKQNLLGLVVDGRKQPDFRSG